MRKLFSFLFCLSGVFVASPGYAHKGLTLVSGHVNQELTQTLALYQVIEGKKVVYATTTLDAQKNFGFAFPSIKEGFYYLADPNKRQSTRIYLKSGEIVELDLNENSYDLKKGSKENKILHEWFTKAFVITNPSLNWQKDTSTYTTYFPKFSAFVPQVPFFKATINTPNAYFNKLMKVAVDADVENAAMHFILTPRKIHPTKEQYPEFFKRITEPAKYKTADLLALGEGVEILKIYTTFYLVCNGNKDSKKPANRLQYNAELFGNDTIRGAYIASSLLFGTYDELENSVAPVKQYLATDSMQAAYFQALKSLAILKKGNPGYNFSYPDVNGNKVSMADLKGKVVLVDVWATWCGPCKKEFPHLKQLEEEFKGQNVEFVSISIDAEKDKEKWKAMIASEHLGGRQLFAATESDLYKYYDIKTIPRFMVFDRQGKIVSVDSPRPSEPELKEILQTTLAEK